MEKRSKACSTRKETIYIYIYIDNQTFYNFSGVSGMIRRTREAVVMVSGGTKNYNDVKREEMTKSSLLNHNSIIPLSFSRHFDVIVIFCSTWMVMMAVAAATVVVVDAIIVFRSHVRE